MVWDLEGILPKNYMPYRQLKGVIMLLFFGIRRKQSTKNN
jgi:hypothetical protein